MKSKLKLLFFMFFLIIFIQQAQEAYAVNVAGISADFNWGSEPVCIDSCAVGENGELECGYYPYVEGDHIDFEIQTEWCQGADINHDGKVDAEDLTLFNGNCGKTNCSEQNNWCDRADINLDSEVGSGDLAIFQANWKKTGCSGILSVEVTSSYLTSTEGSTSITLVIEDLQSSTTTRDVWVTLTGPICLKTNGTHIPGTVEIYATANGIINANFWKSQGRCGHYLSPVVNGVHRTWDGGTSEIGVAQSASLSVNAGDRIQIYLRNTGGGCVDGTHDDHKARSTWEGSAQECSNAPYINLTLIEPDPYSKYNKSSNPDLIVKYTDIFENENYKCIVQAIDPDAEDSTLSLDWRIDFVGTGKNYDRTEYIDGVMSVTNGQTIEIPIPTNLIFPSDNIVCNVSARDEMGAESENAEAELKMPSFDLFVKRVDAMNVISGTDLVAGKPCVARLWAEFSSDLIDDLDKEVSAGVLQKSSTTGSTQKKYSTKILKNYSSKEQIIQQLISTQDSKFKNMLKEIKRAEDSYNFLGFSTSQYPDIYQYSGAIDTGCSEGRNGDIKENDETNNNIFDSGEDFVVNLEKRVRAQEKDFKFLFVPVTKKTEKNILDGLGGDISFFIKKSYDFVLSTYPFDPRKTNYEESHGIIYIDYDEDKFENMGVEEKAAKSKQLRKQVYKELEKQRRLNNADIVVGVILDDNLIYHTEILRVVPGLCDRKGTTHPLILYRAGGDVTVLAHELGHAIGYLDEDYFPGSFGKVFEEHGWNLAASGGDIGPRINIWTYPDPFTGGFSQKEDRPEDMATSNRVGGLGMPKYYNIMADDGVHLPNIWTDKSSYLKIMDKLVKRGVL